ncbi:winged helix-turn-helix transcriptional regulator [Candidatus Woesearchaeota archaeon]|nr:winged helix-turn-helix transcriptional regulator [Candidatus Woesearchaeota archaeon]
MVQGIFCEVYGNTIHNQVIEYLLENQFIDFAVGDMAKELDISRPKAYQIIEEFEKKEYVKKSRIIGRTQLYKINKESDRINLFLKNFKECLRLVVEENECKKQNKQIGCYKAVSMATKKTK